MTVDYFKLGDELQLEVCTGFMRCVYYQVARKSFRLGRAESQQIYCRAVPRVRLLRKPHKAKAGLNDKAAATSLWGQGYASPCGFG